jgi:hypothetical protein
MTKEDRAEQWVEKSLEELGQMAKKYDLTFETSLIGNNPMVRFEGTGAYCDFPMRLIDDLTRDDDLMGQEFRYKHFFRELSRWIAGYAGLPVDKINTIMLGKLTTAKMRGMADSFPLDFKVIPPDWVIKEGIEQGPTELIDRLRRMTLHWTAGAIDFELFANIDAGHVKRGVRDTWKEKCYVNILVQDDEDDKIIEMEKRAELYLKAVIIPDLQSLYDESVKVSYTDVSMAPSVRYVGHDDMFKTLWRILKRTIERNKTKAKDQFHTKLMIQLETVREMR